MMGLMMTTSIRRLLLGVGLCAAVAASEVKAQSPTAPKMTLVEPPAPLLPEHFGAYSTTKLTQGAAQIAVPTAFDGANCAPIVEGVATSAGDRCAAILKEDGLLRFAAASYTGGGVPAHLSAFEFVDATGAYSAYTFYRTYLHAPRVSGTSFKPGRPAGETTTDADETLIWVGTAVLSVKGHVGKADLDSLTNGLPKVGGRKGLAPLLPRLMPLPGFDAASLRYALGPVSYQAMGGVLPPDILSWDKSAEGATATYGGRAGKGVVTLLLYPTPQIAGDRGRAIEKTVNDLGTSKFGEVKMRRLGPLVGMTSGSLSAEQAQKLMAALHLNEEVTYDKPMPLEFHTEVKKTASLLQNIAVLSGVLIVAAILLGLFLGGARAGIRVLRGKPAASEPEFLTINLRDKPKALFSRVNDEAERTNQL